MTLVNIDLRNAGYETGLDDRVVFYSPANRNEQGTIISTAEASVPLVDGQAEKELAPGPVVVQILAQGVADTRPKSGYVPEEGPVSLWDVVLDWTPALIDQGILAILVAVEDAVGRVAGAVAAEVEAIRWFSAVNLGEGQDFRDLPIKTYPVPGGAVATALGLPVPRVGSLEIMRGNTNNSSKMARFTTNDQGVYGPLEIWQAATDQQLNWGSWKRVFPLPDDVARLADLDSARWASALNLTDTSDLKALAPRVYAVPSIAVASGIGLPVSRLGSVEVLPTNVSGVGKVIRFTTNDQGAFGGIEVWTRATNTAGEWANPWVKIHPPRTWESAKNLTRDQHYTGLPVGSYSVAGGGDATAIGLPVPRIGNLEILRGNFNNSIKIARFTTNYDPTSGIEIWHTATNTAGAWSGQWVRTDGAGEIDVTDQIQQALMGYATQSDVSNAIASLPTGFGVDPDGIPYITIGA